MLNFLRYIARLAAVAFLLASALPVHGAEAGKFVIVGMGTSPDLMTIRAQHVIAGADILLAEEGSIRQMWPELAAGKEVWEWPHSLRKFYGADLEKIADPARRAEAAKLEKVRHDLAGKIAEAVKSGKTVACLQSGDPMMYGMTLFLEMLPPGVATEIIPGIGAFQAASAALKHSPPYGYDTSAVILTMDDWPGRADLNETLMKAGSTMVFYTMNLDYPRLFEQLKRHYPAATPVAVVTDAGDPAQQKVILSTVGSFLTEVDYRVLPVNRHLLFVGKFLKSGQARLDFTPRVTESSPPR
ncbi:MAG: hypothetical protein IT169_16080 [Bryobacterales bacterium]|nr:hypothetical protein [Bryobacterales bacterium]